MKLKSSASIALAATIFLNSSLSFAQVVDPYVENLGNNMSITGESTDDATISNSDYEVKDSEVKKQNVKVENGGVNIEGTLYVYGDLTISNDDLKISGKLKVTGNLTVNNGDIINNGRLYVFGKKKVTNGGSKGTPIKLSSNIAKFDPYLQAELTSEELTQVKSMITDYYTEIETLKKQLKDEFTKKGDVDGTKSKINETRENFYNDLETYIQSEDLGEFQKIKDKEITTLNKFLDQIKGKEILTFTAKEKIKKAVDSIPESKRIDFINSIIGKLDLMKSSSKDERKTLLLGEIKKVFENEYEKNAGNITQDTLIKEVETETTTGTVNQQTSTGSIEISTGDALTGSIMTGTSSV